MASKFMNPPSALAMSDFLAHSQKSGGLAKSARFIVRFPNRILDGGIEDLSYLCEAAEFPGRSFMHSGYRYYGPEFKMPHQTQYDDLNLTFLVRDTFGEREFFDNWMMKINPISTYDFNYRINYATEIEIFHMQDVGGPGYQMNFEKAWPIAIQPMPVTWADDNYHRLVVSFTYTRWYRKFYNELSRNSFKIATGESLNLADTSADTSGLIPNDPNSARGQGQAPAAGTFDQDAFSSVSGQNPSSPASQAPPSTVIGTGSSGSVTGAPTRQTREKNLRQQGLDSQTGNDLNRTRSINNRKY